MRTEWIEGIHGFQVVITQHVNDKRQFCVDFGRGTKDERFLHWVA